MPDHIMLIKYTQSLLQITGVLGVSFASSYIKTKAYFHNYGHVVKAR